VRLYTLFNKELRLRIEELWMGKLRKAAIVYFKKSVASYNLSDERMRGLLSGNINGYSNA
jgi:hypothetical protein